VKDRIPLVTARISALRSRISAVPHALDTQSVQCWQAGGYSPGNRSASVRGVRELDGRPADAGIYKAGDGTRLSMIVLHDDAQREYAYGPAQGLPDTRVGTFTQALYDEAKKDGRTVISMKNDWKRILAFE
jgi:hypothetical protein